MVNDVSALVTIVAVKQLPFNILAIREGINNKLAIPARYSQATTDCLHSCCIFNKLILCNVVFYFRNLVVSGCCATILFCWLLLIRLLEGGVLQLGF